MYYTATVEPPSAVSHSIYCHFTGALTHNLVVSKVNHLEIYDIGTTGITANLKIPLNGRVTGLCSVPLGAGNSDYLFLTTEKEQWCLLQYVGAESSNLPEMMAGEVRTLQWGDLHDRAFRPIERGQIIASTNRVIVLHLVQGLVKVLWAPPVDNHHGSNGGRFFRDPPLNCRIDELQVLDMVMLSPSVANSNEKQEDPILVVLSETYGGGRSLSTYLVGEKGLVPGPWKFEELEIDSHRLITVPEPRGGVLVVADESIFYYNHRRRTRLTVAMRPTRITCHAPIDEHGFRYLLGDADGALYVLFLFSKDGSAKLSSDVDVQALKLEYLGSTTIPATLTYLDSGFVFVGSHYGDSQVVRLLTRRRSEDGSLVEVVERFRALAPLVDFVVADLERIGQNSVVAACGAFKEGAVRVVRQGSNLEILAEISPSSDEGPSSSTIITGMFVTKNISGLAGWSVFLSLPFNTLVVNVDIEQEIAIEASSLPSGGPILSKPTLWAGHIGSMTVQVTSEAAVFLTTEDQRQMWRSPLGMSLSHVAVGGKKLILASAANRQLWSVKANNSDVKIKGSTPIKHQHHASLMGEMTAMGVLVHPNKDSNDETSLVILAFWDSTILHVLNLNTGTCEPLPSSELVDRDSPYGGQLIRSIASCTVDGKTFLLWGTGEGNLYYAQVIWSDLASSSSSSTTATVTRASLFQLGEIHRAVLGKEPVRLIPLDDEEESSSLLAISNRPFLVTVLRGRLVFSLTNLKDITAISPCPHQKGHSSNSDDDGIRLLVATESGVLQSMCLERFPGQGRGTTFHHQIYPLSCTITRILHLPLIHAYAVLCLEDHHPYEVMTDDVDVASFSPSTKVRSVVKLLDQDTMDPIDTYVMPAKERAHSLTLAYLITNNQTVLVVGTAIVKKGEQRGEEPQAGRLLTFGFGLTGRTLRLLHQLEVPGCVYAVVPVDGKLAATINGMTCLYRWTTSNINAASGGTKSNTLISSPSTSNQLLANTTEMGGWMLLHSHFGQILGIKLDVAGAMLAVGDLMKSVSLLTVAVTGDRLQEVARDYEARWMTEVRLLDEGGGTVLTADNLGNLLVLSKGRDPHFSAPRSRLTILSGFHLGELVNCIRPGTLARLTPDTETLLLAPHLIGTATGALYLFGRLSESISRPIRRLEENLCRLIRPVGQFDYKNWRMPVNERKRPTSLEIYHSEHDTSSNDGGGLFIDGDLVARFLELSPSQQIIAAEGGEASCEPTGMNVTALRQLVESLIAAHQ